MTTRSRRAADEAPDTDDTDTGTDTTSETTAPETDDGPDTSNITAEPDKNTPVVLATVSGSEFVLPGQKDDGSDTITVGPEGVALSQKDADAVREAAKKYGVELIEKGTN